jgi:ABC-2 type transport system permease protein
VNTLALYRTLKEYDAHACINLIDIDPNNDEETMEKINPDNALTLSTGDMVLVCGDTKKRIPGNTMYTTNSDDDGNAVSQTFNGETIIFKMTAITMTRTAIIQAMLENFLFLKL